MIRFLFLLCILIPISNNAYAEGLKKSLTWVGCGISKKAFVGALAKAYEEKTGIHINIEGGGATRGIRDVAKGISDIGGTCRHKITGDDEKKARLTPVGWDAIVVITHKDNPVKNIAFYDLRSVFRGEITNWKELGGRDSPIQVVARKGKISGVGRMARELIFKNPDEEFLKKAILLKSSGPVEKYIEDNLNSIALSGISSAKKRQVSFLTIDHHSPDYENVASGIYPLHRPLYLVSHEDTPDEVLDFIRFATSIEGQTIIKNEGTVNLRDGAKLWPTYRKKMKDARQEGNF